VIYASSGTSLLKIATDYNIPYKYLLDFNEKKSAEDVLAKEELVFLQRKRRQGSNEFHTVASGETLKDIAQAEGIRLENLCSFNQLSTSMQPAEGEQLNLQDFAYARPKLAGSEVQAMNTKVTAPEQNPATGSNPKKVLHVVQTKETLYAISKKYGVPVNAVKEWNQLESEALKIGQELIIYPTIQ
jgi:LysM repeat protein